MPELILYHRETCPFCLRVRKWIQKKGIAVPLKDITDPRYRQELVKTGGQQQVPCLVIDGKALYESDDIIAWLEKNYK
jgi:glutaredoxin